MTPGKLDLPTIWRGCDWGPVTLRWKDQDGHALNLDPPGSTVWVPKAQSLNIDLHAAVTGASEGVTQLLLTKEQTAILRLGVERWQWIWEIHAGGGVYRYPPFLSGKVTIADPVVALDQERPPTGAGGIELPIPDQPEISDIPELSPNPLPS